MVRATSHAPSVRRIGSPFFFRFLNSRAIAETGPKRSPFHKLTARFSSSSSLRLHLLVHDHQRPLVLTDSQVDPHQRNAQGLEPAQNRQITNDREWPERPVSGQEDIEGAGHG